MTSKDIIISPSILSADFANLERDIKLVQEGGAKWVHVDVMDGHFVPNITIGVPVVASLRKVTDMVLDVHLMIDDPIKYIPDFIQAGADIITFHVEATGEDTQKTIDMIKKEGVKAGISIKPKTPVQAIKPYLKDLDLVLVMTVEPGFGGQSFIQECAYKIKLIKEMCDETLEGEKRPVIQVDGGINEETAEICKEYGAASFVAGNYIYKSKDVKRAIESLM